MAEPLLEGFKQFREENYRGNKPLMPRLVLEGQTPEYFIISCIDSRSNPGTIFKPQPGTFLAHKAMGAIVRPYKKGTALAAALQFALEYNRVKKIVLLGHTNCSAIQALVDEIDDEEISSFIDVAQCGLQKAKDRCSPNCTPKDLLRYAEEQIVLQSMNNLRLYPSVAKALKENRVEINAWLFDMESGDLLGFDESQNKFTLIVDEIEKRRTKTLKRSDIS